MKILSTRSRAARQARMQELIDDALIIYKTPATYNPEALQEDFYFKFYFNSHTTELLEHARCLKDPLYFISNYLRVDNCHLEQNCTMKEWEHQAQVVHGLEGSGKIIVKHPRQAGMTTISVAYTLWQALFHHRQTILFASPTHARACETHSLFRKMYEGLPTWLRPNLHSYQRNQLNFVNGSMVRFTACTESLGQGMTLSMLVLDDFARVRPEIARHVWESIIPCLVTTSSKLLVSSTPNLRDDLFAELWAAGEAGQSFLDAINISYWQLPMASQENAQADRAIIGEDAFRRECLAEFV